MAVEAAGERPRLRGTLHQYAFFVALAASALLVAAAPTPRATLACAIYALGLCGLLGVSALYHRITWRPRARLWMRRLDHSMIFVLIAGTYTPFALLAISGALSTVVLSIVWGGAVAGIALNLWWVEAPKWLTATVYVALGWVAVAAMPELGANLGAIALILLIAGGAAYTAGAVVYALGRPNPVPGVFGYHEVFHTLVIVAAAAHYADIALYVLPEA